MRVLPLTELCFVWSWTLCHIGYYLDKRWAHSCFAVSNCSWGQRCEEVGWIFPFLLLKIGGPDDWACSPLLRFAISAFPVNLDPGLLNYLVLIERRILGLLFVNFVWLLITFWRLFSIAHVCTFARKTLMNWGNCKKQKKGMQLHCHISKQHGFLQALREGAFANVRIIFKTACNFTIDNSRWNSEHK